jgi:hypothetical protein
MKKLLVILLAISLVFFFMSCTPPGGGFKLVLSINGSGSVAISPEKATYNADEEVTLTPSPESGYSFINWSGTNASDVTDNGDGTYKIKMDANKILVANFDVAAVTVIMTADYGDTGTLPASAYWNLVFSTEDNLIAYNTYGSGSAWGPTYSSTDATIDWNELVVFDPGAPNNGTTVTTTIEPGTWDWGVVIDSDGDGDYEAGTNYVITWGESQPAFADRKVLNGGDTVEYTFNGTAGTGENVIEVKINDEVVYSVQN